MKPSRHHVLLCALLLTLPSCKEPNPNDHVDEGAVTEGTYSSDELGWRIAIPKGSQVVTRSQTDDLQDKGRAAIEQSTGEQVDTSGLKNLVSFKWDQFNIFQSTTEPFVEEFEGEWAENNLALRDLIVQTYRDQGIEVDASELETEVIGGLEFQRLTMRIVIQNGDLILNQIMYNRLINGLDFGASLTYADEEHGRKMLDAWRNSEFGL